MNRRQYVRLAGSSVASIGIAGCASSGPDTEETADPDGGDTDVSVSVVKNAPDEPEPYENESGDVISEQESDALAVDGIIFQRAGDKGLVVSGDATNTSDQAFDTVSVAVTLYDENETEDDILDSTAEGDDHGQLDAGAIWQWTAQFGERPEFGIDYYEVTVTANYP